MDLFGIILFGLAVAHSFIAEDVEYVFPIWAAVYWVILIATQGTAVWLSQAKQLSFTEPLFVIAIMTIAATRPVVELTRHLIFVSARVFPAHAREMGFFFSAMVLGPLSGSLITEPAAMTITALILRKSFFSKNVSESFKYAVLGTLFVNVSIGGTLTPFAAPPVLMIAGRWGWSLATMFLLFGWKAILAVVVNTAIVVLTFRKEFSHPDVPRVNEDESQEAAPNWLTALHFAFLVGVIVTLHHPTTFLSLLAAFLVLTGLTRRYQSPSFYTGATTRGCAVAPLKEAAGVGAFLAGLVILGYPQRGWIEPLIRDLGSLPLYFGTALLTAVTDNATLTYLGSLVPSLTDSQKYSLVAGAVAGGGLTLIANAPNPAGHAILSESFGSGGIRPLRLLKGALIPTAVALLSFALFSA